MLKVIRTTSENIDFQNLVKELDAYLKITDDDEHDFYNQFNGLDTLKGVAVAYWNDIPVGCGAIKVFSQDTVEIKRMFVSPKYRGNGIASQILNTLELMTTELKFKSCILETGKRQEEAVAFYHKTGYSIIPNYGQYTRMKNSVCFEKTISKK